MGRSADLTTSLGPIELRTPLVAASGTVGSVVELKGVADLTQYGAAVAKSVSEEPWPGRKTPRMAPVGLGMLNSIGIQNPGIDAWVAEIGPQITDIEVPLWGSAVGKTAAEFGRVAARLEEAGVAAVEVNLSCPNIEGHSIFALDPIATSDVVAAVRDSVSLPIGAKLSPNAEDIVTIADAARASGADWLTLTNTVWGAGIDVSSRRPMLSGLIGGYSGPGLKPIALRCVLEVHNAFPDIPIVGCGGVNSGSDVIEYLLGGASAVCIGTAHFDRPGIASDIVSEIRKLMRKEGVDSISDYIGAYEPW